MEDLDEDYVGVGAIGTIGSLMSRELQYLQRTNPQRKAPRKLQSGAVSVFCEASYSLKGQIKSSGTIQRPRLVKCRSEGRGMRKKPVKGRKSVSDMEEWRSGYEMPMLDWQRSRKNGVFFVDVVDLKCTSSIYSFSHENDKSWGFPAFTSRFMKRLSFSRLSV